MLKCEYCGGVFDEPVVRQEQEDMGDGVIRVDQFWTCPICGEDAPMTAVEECPVCGGWMDDGDHICEKCRKTLASHLAVCLDVLEPAELDQLDEWLDGTSIKEYRRFK